MIKVTGKDCYWCKLSFTFHYNIYNNYGFISPNLDYNADVLETALDLG